MAKPYMLFEHGVTIGVGVNPPRRRAMEHGWQQRLGRHVARCIAAFETAEVRATIDDVMVYVLVPEGTDLAMLDARASKLVAAYDSDEDPVL